MINLVLSVQGISNIHWGVDFDGTEGLIARIEVTESELKNLRDAVDVELEKIERKKTYGSRMSKM